MCGSSCTIEINLVLSRTVNSNSVNGTLYCAFSFNDCIRNSIAYESAVDVKENGLFFLRYIIWKQN